MGSVGGAVRKAWVKLYCTGDRTRTDLVRGRYTRRPGSPSSHLLYDVWEAVACQPNSGEATQDKKMLGGHRGIPPSG